jgi:hypothetical protein
MHSPIANFIRRARRITTAGVCLAACLAAAPSAQAAYGVTVTQEGDTLYILGNDNSNSVGIIGSNKTPGTVGVFVVDVPWVYKNVQNIHVDLQGGDNYLSMDGLDLDGDVTVMAGDGDDEFRLEECYFYAALVDMGDGDNDIQFGSDTMTSGIGIPIVSVETGAGGDRVSMRGVECGDMTINTREGNDVVGVGASHASWMTIGCEVAGDLVVETGRGADIVAIAATDVYGDTEIAMGRHDDTLLTANLGGSPHNEFFGAFTAHGGNGQDTLWDDPANVYHVAPQFQSFELP